MTLKPTKLLNRPNTKIAQSKRRFIAHLMRASDNVSVNGFISKNDARDVLNAISKLDFKKRKPFAWEFQNRAGCALRFFQKNTHEWSRLRNFVTCVKVSISAESCWACTIAPSWPPDFAHPVRKRRKLSSDRQTKTQLIPNGFEIVGTALSFRNCVTPLEDVMDQHKSTAEIGS